METADQYADLVQNYIYKRMSNDTAKKRFQFAIQDFHHFIDYQTTIPTAHKKKML